MITIGYSTREHNPEHISHIIKMCGLGDKKTEVIEIVNKGEKSLTQCYNEILDSAKNDIIVFLHDDITINTKQFGNKLIKHFDNNVEYGIIGVAGTKFLSQTGRWWDNPKKMYGRVEHTHEGKTWLSSYSNDLGNDLEEVVIVDGVFFAVNRNRLKKKFDESVEGFHFYDVDFCFQNHLEGVKVGVFTNIRINHRSIGMTNDKWEENRVKFSEKYADKLPVKVKRRIRKGDKIKVLLGCLNFNNYTGSELYVYELAKELTKQNCEVSICSNIGNPLAQHVKKYGIKLYNLNEPPGYKMGDGKWMLKTVNGDVPSKEKVLYKVEDIRFDVLHLNHKPITEYLLKLYPDVNAVTTIHSEVISLEEPVISENIKKYITIRPEISEFLTDKHNISEDKIKLIYNPIDTDRFKPKNVSLNKTKRLLFVGTIDYLRKNTIFDLVETTKERGMELWLVGKNSDSYLDGILNENTHVKYYEPTYNVENFIHQVDETAGILLGRTTIEGWLCNKPGWIYDIDMYGVIKNKKFVEVPSDLDKFTNKIVAKEVIKEYLDIIE